MADSDLRLLAVAVGNTRTRVGLFEGRTLHDPASFPNADGAPALLEAMEEAAGERPVQVVVASVNESFSGTVAEALETRGVGAGWVSGVWRAGRDLPVAMSHTLEDATTVGADRWLNALAAWTRARQACVVVDAGTCVTVDFVDGEGTFHGGVIAPGIRLMLASMHSGTAALPEVGWDGRAPEGGPFGRSTRDAMIRGAIAAVRGLVRERVEAYAEHYGGYPQIVATGGDGTVLFEHSDLVEHIVPDLQLIGIQSACERALADGAGDDASDDGP